MKFKKGDIVVSKDKSYNDPDTIIVTRIYGGDGNDEKFDGYSMRDGRTYAAMLVDWYRVESTDNKDKVESQEDNLCYVDRLWSNLRKICFDLPCVDSERLFGQITLSELIQKYDPDEIMSIMEDYNDKHSNLKPGDEIQLIEEDELVVVISINAVHESFNVLNKDGVIRDFYYAEACWEKTGKHYFELDTLISALKYWNECVKNGKENI